MPFQDAIYLLRSLLGLGLKMEDKGHCGNERYILFEQAYAYRCCNAKKISGYQQQYSSQGLVLAGGGGHANGAIAQGSQSHGEPNNTTIFVGGLDSDVNEEDLRQPFSQFGEVVSVKIPVGKACGSVQFANRKDAENAMNMLNATVIGKQTVLLPWCRSQGNKQWRSDSSNQWNNGGQGYGGYANAAPQNPDLTHLSMHAAAAVNGYS